MNDCRELDLTIPASFFIGKQAIDETALVIIGPHEMTIADARTKNLWCERHTQPHIIWGDAQPAQHVCMECVKQIIYELGSSQVACDLYERIVPFLHPDDVAWEQGVFDDFTDEISARHNRALKVASLMFRKQIPTGDALVAAFEAGTITSYDFSGIERPQPS